MTTKNYWLAFGIGISAGVAIALYYAPNARRRFRNSVGEAGTYIEEAAEYLKAQADRLSKEAHNAIDRTKGQVEAVVDKTSGTVSGLVKSAQSLV